MKSLSQPGAATAEDRERGRRHAAARCCHWLGVIDIDHFKRVNDTWN